MHAPSKILILKQKYQLHHGIQLPLPVHNTMKNTTLAMASLLVAGGIAAAAPSRNLLGAGSGFEVGPHNFIAVSEQRHLLRDGESSLYDPENPHEGEYSLRLVKDGIWSLPPIPGREDAHLVTPGTRHADSSRRGCLYFNLVKLEKGKSYTLSAWVRGQQAQQPFLMEVNEPVADGKSNAVTRNCIATPDWQRFVLTFKMEKSEVTDHRCVKIWLPASENQAVLWIDAVQLEEGEAATDYQAEPFEFGAVIEKPGRIFREDEAGEAKATLRFRNNTEAEGQFAIRYTISDYWFKEVKSGIVQKSVAPHSGAMETLPLPALPCGYYRIVFEGDHGAYDEAIYAVYRPMEYRGPLPDYWPLSVESGDHLHGEGTSPLQLIRDLGYGWLRGCVYLHDVGKSDGTFSFDTLDPILDEAQNANLRLLLCLGNSSRWCPEWSKNPDTGLLDVGIWRNFVAATVAHCRGRADTYEMLNEPNHMPPRQYLEYLKAGYEAAKASDPAARVVGGCATADLGLVPQPWTIELLELGGGKYMDMLSTHLYSDAAPERGRYGVISHYEAVNGQLKKHNAEMPIWHSEKMYCARIRGYSRRKHDIPPEYPVFPSVWWAARDYRQKAAFCIRDAILASVCGKGPFTSMGALPQNNTLCPRNTYIYEFTHIEYDGSPTPEIPAVNGFARMLEGRAMPGRLIALDNDAYAALYHGEKGVLAALWDIQGGKQLRLPELPPHRSYDFFGMPASVSEDVTLEEEPFYLQFDNVSEAAIAAIFERLAEERRDLPRELFQPQ